MGRKANRRAEHSAGLFDELIVDNFAGGGGASMGLERAFGRAVDLAVNHDPEAIAMHATNHPHTRHYCESVWTIKPEEVTGGRPVGLAWFSPDCFPAGTMVLTDRGYRPIEDIDVGDMVLTHKGRFQRVTETNRTRKPLLCIRGHGHPGLLVSPEHPFYARRRVSRWDNSIRAYRHDYESADWVPASILDKGWYWATPIAFPQADVPEVPGRGLPIDERLMWLAGRYLGDGWTRLTDTRAELVITCGKAEANELRTLIDRWQRQGQRSGFGEIAWHERATGTAYQFATNHRGLVMWLREHFGHRAEAKGLPSWALGMSIHLREALLSGYLGADGSEMADFWECTTVSKSMAFSIKALANSLGKTVAVYTGPNTNVIEGRVVNARNYYRLRWRHQVDPSHEQTKRDHTDSMEWCPIREVTDTGELSEVFNIGVEEDESYVVEGIIVHNCKHFSSAKGGKPVEKKIRGLAWVVVRWAKRVKPRVIMLENVREFLTWGPLGPDDRPCPRRKGIIFKRWVGTLRNLGYAVEWRVLDAADFGAPTHRRRLFLIARCDGERIAWPEPTHGPGRSNPYRTAAECIDWSLPCPSIFLSKDEARAVGVKRPLADKTLRRIAMGLKKFVFEAANPFIVRCNHGGKDFRGQSCETPLGTITGKHGFGVATPFLTAQYGEAPHQETRGQKIDEPIRTVTPRGGGGFSLIAPMISDQYGDRPDGSCHEGQRFDEPLSTITSGGKKHAVVAAHLTKFFGGVVGQEVSEPLPTVTSIDHNGVVTASLTQYNDQKGNEARGQHPCEPILTVTPAPRFTLTSAILAGVGGRAGQSSPRSVDRPAATATAKADTAVVAANLVQMKHGDSQWASVAEPLRTNLAGANHHGLTVARVEGDDRTEQVRAFLTKYYGTATGQPLLAPLGAATGHDRFGLVTIRGTLYRVIDIGLRMLSPRELYRCQGFPDSYVIDPVVGGRKLPKDAQVRMVGNSVCPQMSECLARANFPAEAAPVRSNPKPRRRATAGVA